MTVGERIKQRRMSLGWSRARLAKETGIPYPTLSSLESGDTRTSTSTAIIAAALGVDPLWLSSGRSRAELGDSSALLPLDERNLLGLFRLLPDRDKEIAIRIVRGLVGSGE